MLGWLKRRRRARLLAEPFPPEWRNVLERETALWRVVPRALRPKLEADLRVFAAERHWEPCGGLDLRGAMRAVIAAQACLLTLGRSVDAYDHVRSILVYPEEYRAPEVYEDEAGVVTEEIEDREGEAWERGIVVLSWADVRADARNVDGRNLVLHEFAHQLDLWDFLDQTLAAPDERERRGHWREVLEAEYEALCQKDEEGRRDPALDTYGAEDAAEFFAVATESFFERPAHLKRHHQDLYGVLTEYYAVDPEGWDWDARGAESDTPKGRPGRRMRRMAARRARRKRGA